MAEKIKMLGLTLGDPLSHSSRSGVNYNIFSRFNDNCELINVFDLDVRGINKLLLAVNSFSLDRKEWGNKLHQNPWAFEMRTRMAERNINNISKEINLIFQDGAMFMPGLNPVIPFVSYHDSNVILSAKGGEFAHGAHYNGARLSSTIAQEKKVYEKAALIFTMSDWLKNSLVTDFGISENKIKTVYAGTNLKICDFDKNYDGKTILFIGKNFKRKGGEVLLEAFIEVKKEIPDAKLIIIGPNIRINEKGVEVKGLVNNKEELEEYFKQASLFVLPSLFEPFGIVFAEAFAYKNPCIATNICAMPEIIEEGKGGFVIPPNDPDSLSKRIVAVLKNKELAKEMGEYGFEKAKNVFNWDVVVEKMIKHILTIL